MSSTNPDEPLVVQQEARPARNAPPRKIYHEKHIYSFFIILCLAQTIFLGSLLYFLNSLHIPDLRNVAGYQPKQATILYGRDGAPVDRISVENRTVIALDMMSPYLLKAFVAAEDGRFFDHSGLDYFSLLRAFLKNLVTGAKSQGGSTITQQITKSLLLTPEKTYIRKFKEAILAWRIEKLLSKDEILFIYLNQIYLGEGAHGVEAAAQVYFGKSAKQLTLSECALLAGLPQAPSKYSLFSHLEVAQERQKYVLDRMVADGIITRKQAQQAAEEKIQLQHQGGKIDRPDGYYMEAAKRTARDLLGVPLQAAGAKIYTNLDQWLQNQAVIAVRRGMRANLGRNLVKGKDVGSVPQAALVCLEIATGKVRAMVGGGSFTDSPFDRASQARRPAGSTFKPFVYLAALNRGYTAQSLIDDSPLSIAGNNGKIWSPKNYGNRYHGMTTLTDALASSLNAATVRLMQKIGYRDVHSLAQRAGFTSKLTPDLSLALGAVDVSLLELTAAYQIFAGDGTFIAPSLVQRLDLADGRTLFPERDRKRSRVIERRVLSQIQGMLRQVVIQGTGKAAAVVPNVRGGKTGTSNDYHDAWFIGYDNRYVTGVWVGYDDNRSLGSGESGGSTAAPIWRDFMLSLQQKGS